MFHQEADGIPAFAAAETFKKSFCRRYSEGGRFFVVKRAIADIIAAPFFQLYEFAHYINDIDAVLYLFCCMPADHGVTKLKEWLGPEMVLMNEKQKTPLKRR